MEIAISELRSLCEHILVQRGLSQTEARSVVDDYLDAELREKRSHGLAAFGVVAADAAARGHCQLVMENGCVAFFEGNGDIGHLVARKALEWAREACRHHGMALVGIRNIRRFATPGSIAELGSKEGLISLIFEYGGAPVMAPYGSADPVLSTNPIGIGIPTSRGPILLDMATSERAFYFITLARRLGQEIPPTWALDANGRPTTDPSAAKAVCPFGSYKGSGLAFMLEILTGILVGVDVGLEGKLSRRGALMLFLDPSIFGVRLEHFDKKVIQLVSQVKHSRVAPGSNGIDIPGERGQRKKAAVLKAEKIELDEKILAELRSLSD